MKEHRKKSSGKWILFVVFMILGIYLVNLSLEFFKMPKIMLEFENWVLLISGILLGLGALNFLRPKRRHSRHF